MLSAPLAIIVFSNTSAAQELFQTFTGIFDIYEVRDSSHTINLRYLYLIEVINYVQANPLGLGLYYNFLDQMPTLDLGYASFIYIFGYIGALVLIYLIAYYFKFIFSKQRSQNRTLVLALKSMLFYLILINFTSEQFFLGPGAGMLYICLAIIHHEKNRTY